MKAKFFRKVPDINAMFNECNDDEFCERKYIVMKIINLSGEKFIDFCHHFLCDYNFISNNKDCCKVENEIVNCLKISSKDFPFAILVDPQGYDYARYVAFVWRRNHE